jgi:hypothetical protein
MRQFERRRSVANTDLFELSVDKKSRRVGRADMVRPAGQERVSGARDTRNQVECFSKILR